MLVKKGIKICSEKGDGHLDGDSCVILGEMISPPELQEKSKGMYIILFSNDNIPVLTVMQKIQVTDNELVNFHLTMSGELYLDSIKDTLKVMKFKFYDQQ